MLPKEGVIVNLPNKLTIFRIFLIPVIMIVYSISNWRMNSFIFPNLSVANFVVLLLIFIGALTDFLDGHIARKYNLVTNLNSSNASSFNSKEYNFLAGADIAYFIAF